MTWMRNVTSPGMTVMRMSGTPSKADLRAAALERRDALSGEQRAAAAQAIAARGLPMEIHPRRRRRRLFADPQRDRSDAVDASARREGREIGAAGHHRRAASRCGFAAGLAGDKLLQGPLGILEPSPAAADIIPDIVLVPLAAFDRSGHRIGYGAGHYDRTLAQLRKSKGFAAIGLAFAAQQVKTVPALQHDVALDYVLTETQVFDFRSC